MLDVGAEIEISAEPTAVASIMFDPNREPEWVSVVQTVEVLDPGIKPGARVRRTGSFAGQPIAWTTEVASFHFPHVLERRLIEGPFVGTVSYQVGRSASGSLVRIRYVGRLEGLGALLPEPALTDRLQSTMAANLARLKTLVEQPRA